MRQKSRMEGRRVMGKESQPAQVAHPDPRYEKRGQSEAARQLGLDRDDVRRAFKEDKLAQHGPVSLGGRGNKSGEREAARQLGLSRQDVQRALKVASLTPEAQQAAHDVGLADNRTALLAGQR